MNITYAKKIMSIRDKKVLVTGGAGFVGSHLCDLLISKGFSVVCVDSLLTGKSENISHLAKNDSFKFINLDIVDSLKVDKLIPDDIGYIFNLASPASPIDYWKYPEETLLVNSVGTLNVLRLAVKLRSRFLTASTSEIYGDPLEHPQKETYFGNVNTFGPRSCYDEGKRFSEAAIRVFIDKYGLDARIVRIFNTYGPRMKRDDGRVVSNFICWALEGKDIKLDGDGSQTRSFCYVTDLVDGLFKAMFSDSSRGEVFNIGNPGEFTIMELAKLIIDMTKSSSKLVLSDSFRTNDPMRRRPDISKAKKILNWTPKVKLEEGISKTIEYFKET